MIQIPGFGVPDFWLARSLGGFWLACLVHLGLGWMEGWIHGGCNPRDIWLFQFGRMQLLDPRPSRERFGCLQPYSWQVVEVTPKTFWQKLKLSQSTDWRSSTRFCPVRAWQTGSWRWLVGEVWAPKTTSYFLVSLNTSEAWPWARSSHSRFSVKQQLLWDIVGSNAFEAATSPIGIKTKWPQSRLVHLKGRNMSPKQRKTQMILMHSGWSNETHLAHCPRLFWGMKTNVVPLQISS